MKWVGSTERTRQRRSPARAWLGIGGTALSLLLVCPAQAQNFDSALASAADAIAGAVEHAGKQRVAVIDFDEIEGQVTALGRFLAEEISADLAEHPRPFAVIDRANLQSILAEHALSMSGLVNPENAKRLGQIAGVDALVLGTYTEFGESYRLSLKAIATDTAEMVASARTNVPKTNALQQLAARPLDQRGLAPKMNDAEPDQDIPATIDTTHAVSQTRLDTAQMMVSGIKGTIASASRNKDGTQITISMILENTTQNDLRLLLVGPAPAAIDDRGTTFYASSFSGISACAKLEISTQKYCLSIERSCDICVPISNYTAMSPNSKTSIAYSFKSQTSSNGTTISFSSTFGLLDIEKGADMNRRPLKGVAQKTVTFGVSSIVLSK